MCRWSCGNTVSLRRASKPAPSAPRLSSIFRHLIRSLSLEHRLYPRMWKPDVCRGPSCADNTQTSLHLHCPLQPSHPSFWQCSCCIVRSPCLDLDVLVLHRRPAGKLATFLHVRIWAARFFLVPCSGLLLVSRFVRSPSSITTLAPHGLQHIAN